MTTRKTLTILAILAAVLITGCAKYPTTAARSGKQLVITMKVAGRISTTDSTDPTIRRYYFIAIDNDANTMTGPWAVVVPPFGGNGWVTSADASRSIGLTSYVSYDPLSPQGYVYDVLPGSFFLNTTSPQSPVRWEIVDGGSSIRVTIDFEQLATSSIKAADIHQLDINFITTNQLALNPDYTYPEREWDSLGSSGQDYVSIDTTSDRTYGSTDDTGDATDPDLDIVFWQVQIQAIK
jgi:hypothetical protein